MHPGSEQLAADGRPSRRESLTSHTVRGLKWIYVATAASIVLQLAFTAIVSRRLDPTAFGGSTRGALGACDRVALGTGVRVGCRGPARSVDYRGS
jgi:hypothetical protein